MIPEIQDLLQKLFEERSDERTNLFHIKILSLTDNLLRLSGRVLSAEDLAALTSSITSKFPGLGLDLSEITVLRKPGNPLLSVGTNLTSLHTSTSFVSELSSQLVFGEQLEILSEEGNWVYTRQSDGYLGWTYKPYLTANPLPAVTHIVLAPSAPIHSQPRKESDAISRVFCGTGVSAGESVDGWTRLSAHSSGWVKSSALRAVDQFPATAAEKRATILQDAPRMVGVPYLWGGSAGNGIDCSGFARLMHRWIGVEIPRDADMQFVAARKVDGPYQPGDLFFFAETGSSRKITHVGVCLGGNKVLHSSRSRNGVYIDDLDERESLRNIFIEARTFLS